MAEAAGTGATVAGQAASARSLATGWRALAGGRWAVAALIAVGALVRLGLVLAGWPATDSDEGTMGLMALHIAAGHDFPLMFYGQTYMGTLQAYIGAALFPVVGPTIFALRLGLLLLFILFALALYALIRSLYGHRYALVALGFAALGGPDLLHAQLLALGGYPETLLFGTLALLLASWLAIRPAAGDGRPRRRRLAAWVALGLVIGLGVWSDLLVAPFLLAAPLPLVLYRRREARWRGLGAAALGLLVGLSPQIAFTLTHLNDNTPSAAAAFLPHGAATLLQLPSHLFTQVAGALFVSLPNITGAGWVCALPVSPAGLFVGWSGARLLSCAGGRLAWSLGLLALGVVAARAAWRGWRGLERPAHGREGINPLDSGAVQAGRLALLLGGALVLALYISSPEAATPLGNARYLIGTQIALPALLWPLWQAALARGSDLTPWPPQAPVRVPPRGEGEGARRGRRAWAAWAALGLLGLAMAGGVAATYAQAPDARARNAASQATVRDLQRLGVRHMYADYWTCFKTAFLSHERITCVVLNHSLHVTRYNRYPPYVAPVQADPHTAYVFPGNSEEAVELAQKATDPSWRYQLIEMDGYVIYLPKG